MSRMNGKKTHTHKAISEIKEKIKKKKLCSDFSKFSIRFFWFEIAFSKRKNRTPHHRKEIAISDHKISAHRWGILLFTPPPGSRARRLGWSQYMHECVGASQGYHGVRVRVRVRSWGGWWVLGGGVSMWGFRCTRGST